MTAPRADSFRLTAEALRTLDPDRYAATLVLPPSARPSIQALYAFAAEVAAVRERVSEPAPGEIRLQWWVDALEGEGHGSVRRNPVADALVAMLEDTELPSGPLVRLLAARRFDLYGDAMPDMNQFEGYAGETVSILYNYAAMILAGKQAVPGVADVAGHLGVAEALVGHVRAFGYNARRGQIFLPFSVFAAHGVAENAILAGQESAGLNAALGQFGELATDHLNKARLAIANVPAPVRPAFAGMALVQADLKRLRQNQAAAFSPLPVRNGFVRLARLVGFTLRSR